MIDKSYEFFEIYLKVFLEIVEKELINEPNIIVDSGGSRWTFSNWFNRAFRTAIANDLLQNTLNEAENYEQDLVKVSYLSDSSKLCVNLQGKIYSRTGKNKRYPYLEEILWINAGGLFHPNCRHDIEPFFGDKEELEELEKEKIPKKDIEENRDNRNKGNYYNRQYFKWKERELKARELGNKEYATFCRKKALNYRKQADYYYSLV